VDRTRIDGIDVMVAQTLLSEVGLDMSRVESRITSKGPSKPRPFDKHQSMDQGNVRFGGSKQLKPLRLISRRVPKLPTLQWLRQGSMLPTLRWSCCFRPRPTLQWRLPVWMRPTLQSRPIEL
jgi:hypothetical protein